MQILIITTLVITIIGLILHRYLSAFYDNRTITYSMGFAMFGLIFALLYTMNFILFFGVVVGIGIAVLCFFQIIFGGILWPVLLPYFYNISKNVDIPKVNMSVYVVWSILVPAFLIITIINLIFVDYRILSDIFNFNLWPYVIAIAILLLGHIIRVIATKLIIFVPSKGI